MENITSINKLIEDSGMITHHKAINILREHKWNLSIAPYYYDNVNNTVREIDLIAEKQFNSSEARYGSTVQINVQLFIECKYIKQEIVFWFDDKNIDGAVEKLEKDTELRILHKRPGADLAMDELHYLSKDKVAKLFSTNTNKEDIIYKAISQCLNSKIYYDQWFNKPIHNEFYEHAEANTSLLKFPVIICDKFDNFFKAEFDNDKYSYETLKDNFQLEVNYTFLDKTKTKSQAEIFLIDIVNFNNLMPFLEIIEKEVKSIIHAKSLKTYSTGRN